jgi:hypothetical protein
MMDRRYRLAVLPVILLALLTAGPASAGLFGKKNKPTPSERVPELINTLKNDGDEHKRCSAAEELRQYDPQQFPDMIPALIDAVLTDKKPAVRAEAVQTLGKLRPVTGPAGAALEQALAKDGSMRVRLQARSSLLQYRWAGYTAAPPKPKDEPPAQSKEPPLAPDVPASAPTARLPRLAPVPAPVPAPVSAGPPPVPVPSPASAGLPPGPRPLPVGTPVSRPGSAPSAPVSSGSAKQPVEEKGPDLTPP